MKIIGVIPARWASKRFEGKVLAPLMGEPMIKHVWFNASQSELLDDVIIACDDERVLKAAKGFGAKAVLTSKDHQSGTDRIAEAVKDTAWDIVVNIQGDEPLLKHEVIDNLINALISDQQCSMATVIRELTNKDEINNPNVVKAVIDEKNNALYFSRSPIPYNRDNADIIYFKHLGIYAYRRDFLFTFTKLPKSPLEKIEKLEQLRALEFGYKIKTFLTDQDTVGVDTPEDLRLVQSMLEAERC